MLSSRWKTAILQQILNRSLFDLNLLAFAGLQLSVVNFSVRVKSIDISVSVAFVTPGAFQLPTFV